MPEINNIPSPNRVYYIFVRINTDNGI